MYRRLTLTYRIVDSLFRHRFLFLVAVLGVTGAVTALVFLRPMTYTASASTKIVSSDLTNALGYQNNSWVSPAQQNVSRLNDLMKDNLPGGFLDSFLKKAKLDHPIDISPSSKDPRLGLLTKKLYTTTESDDVFSVNLVWNNPGEAARLVAAIRDQYIEATGINSQASSFATAKFLDSQIATYRARLDQADQALINYKQAHSGQLPEAQTAEITQLSQLKSELDYLRITARDSEMKRSALQARLSAIRPMSILEQTVSDTPAAAELKKLQAQRSAMIAGGYIPSSWNVQDIDGRIARVQAVVDAEWHKAQSQATDANAAYNSTNTGVTETKLQNNPEYQDISQQLTQADIDQKTQTARIGILEKQIAEYERRVQALPAAQRDLAEKTRDYDVLKKQFEDLLERREQARIKASVEKVAASSTLQPIGAVTAETTAGKKKQLIMVVGGFFIGLICGIGLVIFREWADPSLRYETDAERILGVPVLMALPETDALLELPDGRGARRRGLFGAPVAGLLSSAATEGR